MMVYELVLFILIIFDIIGIKMKLDKMKNDKNVKVEISYMTHVKCITLLVFLILNILIDFRTH